MSYTENCIDRNRWLLLHLLDYYFLHVYSDSFNPVDLMSVCFPVWLANQIIELMFECYHRTRGAGQLFIGYSIQLRYIQAFNTRHILAFDRLRGRQFLTLIAAVAFISKSFSHPSTLNHSYYSFSYSALCLYPFIFLRLLIPTVNKIFHLNTNKSYLHDGKSI